MQEILLIQMHFDVYRFSLRIIAERLSARLLILQCVFSVGGVWCHASGMQLKVWLVRKHPSRLGMQLKHPVYKKLCTIVLSAVAALAVSLSRRQNGKSCDGSEEERARSLARKGRRRQRKCSLNAVNSASRTMSTRESSSA